jgi:hypothetical protein
MALPIVPLAGNAITIVQPDAVLRWHRSGFRVYWRWKSRSRGGRPQVPIEIRSLIRRMSEENPLWGAPRIHGELLKLGIEVVQSTVAKYMARRRPGSGQTWKTSLRNHAAGLGAMDFCASHQLSAAICAGDPATRAAAPDLAQRH